MSKFIGQNKAKIEWEDCLQDVIAGYLKSGAGKTIDQAVIDYLRKRSGRKGSHKYLKTKNLINASSLESISPGDECRGYDVMSLDDRIDVARIVGLSTHWERAVMTLRFVEGYGETEIGNFFGVTESRVSQWIKRIQKRISARIKTEESMVKRQREKEMAGVLSSQKEGNKWTVEQFSFERMEIGKSWSMETINEASF